MKKGKLDRKADAAKGSGSTSPPAGGGGGGGGRGRGAPRAPRRRRPALKRAELRAAERILSALEAAHRASRDDEMIGVVTAIGKGGRRTRLPITVRRRFDKTGGGAVLIRHGRRGDLPDLAHLGQVDAVDRRSWWTYRPEERKVETATADESIAGTALRRSDLLPWSPARCHVEPLESTIVEGRRGYTYLVKPKSPVPYDHALVTVRVDLRLVARVEIVNAAGKVVREIKFSDPRYLGVHRRWTSWIVRDFERDATAIVKFHSIEVGRRPDPALFDPERLAAALKP